MPNEGHSVTKMIDAGSGVGFYIRGTSNSLTRSSDSGASWATISGIAASWIGYSSGTTVLIDSASNLRRSTTKCDTSANTPNIAAPTTHTDAGFTVLGNPIKAHSKWFFPGQGPSLCAGFLVSSDDGLTYSVVDTTLDNAQFDFIATNGTITLALCKSIGQVWGTTDGTTWSVYASNIAQTALWVDFLYASGRSQFLAFSGAALTSGVKPIWGSVDGKDWSGWGDYSATVLRGGYGATQDIVAVAIGTGVNQPIMSEVKTFDKSTQFRIKAPSGGDPNQKFYVRVL